MKRRLLDRIPLKRLALAGGALLVACMGEEGAEAVPSPIDSSTSDDLKKLAQLRIFFGHQSVGGDIVAGLEDLKRATGTAELSIVKLEPGAQLPAAYFAHGTVGQNRAPKSKFDGFAAVVDGELKGKVDVALMKLCYVDIDRTTDVEAILKDYVAMVQAVKSRHPELVVVHVTSPLMVVEGWNRMKYYAKVLMGVENDNVRRNRFNQLLRERFAGEPIFDLEAIESTRPDGSREDFEDGKNFAMVHAYTYDGGHLNEAGRQRVARELARFMAKLSVAQQPTADNVPNAPAAGAEAEPAAPAPR
ncbi:MAG: SGNH/GDSL hydrolase family protein [Deltaproteobacteria bacterium]|nr:SGNH/GDSL hydrolase family protein [Deltaproteobacteria bacterium]